MDPKAAAAAAEAAAAAARAAAEAAAAAEQEAAAGRDGATAPGITGPTGLTDGPTTATPTLATTSGARATDDTGAIVSDSADAQSGDADMFRDLALGGLTGDRDSALLPGMEVSGGVGDVGGALQGPTASFTDSGGDVQDQSGLSDSWIAYTWAPKMLVQVGAGFVVGAGEAAVEKVGEYFEEEFRPKETTGPTTEDGVDAGPGDEDVDPESAGTDGTSDRDLDAGTPDDSESADPAAGGTTAPSDPPTGGGVGDAPPDEQEFVKPPGWVDIDGFGRLGAGNILDAGSGRQSDSSSGGLQPQGGDWAINPSPEASIGANAEGALERASGSDWFGQPAGSDSGEMAAGNLSSIAPTPMVDPNTVDPGDGEGSTSDGEAQASTAYRTTAAPAETSDGETSSASIGDGGGLTETMPIQEEGSLTGPAAEPADDRAMPFAMPAVDDDDGEGHGRGHGHGRDGDRGEHGRGRDGGDDDLE